MPDGVSEAFRAVKSAAVGTVEMANSLGGYIYLIVLGIPSLTGSIFPGIRIRGQLLTLDSFNDGCQSHLLESVKSQELTPYPYPGRFSDGTVRDLTSTAELKSANGEIAEVDRDGIVKPAADGQTAISVVAKAGDETVTAEARVTVEDSQHESFSFVDGVMPLMNELGCNAAKCHGSQDGQAGLKLSMFGADPDRDYLALTRFEIVRQK